MCRPPGFRHAQQREQSPSPLEGEGWGEGSKILSVLNEMTKGNIPDRTELAPGLSVSRVVTGLWQVADMERGGKALDLDRVGDPLPGFMA